MKDANKVREMRVGIFNALIAHAQAIIDRQKARSGSVADACKMVNAAMKALPVETGEDFAELIAEADQKFVEQVAQAYGKAEQDPTVSLN